jgi:hypothetical protein
LPQTKICGLLASYRLGIARYPRAEASVT